MRRLHGRAIERAYQTGNEPMVCTHHGEESYYAVDKLPKPKPKNEKRKGEKDGKD